MKLTKKELIDSYLPKTDGSARSACPSADDLGRAAAGEMGQAERQSIATHLTVCRDCAEEYRSILPLQSFAEGAAAAVSNRPAPPAVLNIQRRRSTWDTRLPGWQPSYALAASLLVACIGLGVWALSIRRDQRSTVARLENDLAERSRAAASATASLEKALSQLAELSQPYLNVPIVELDPRGAVRDSTVRGSIQIPSAAGVFTLVLNAAGPLSYASYRLDIVDRAERLVWSGPGLRKSEYNTFTLVLPRRLLPAGQYRFKLFGVSGNQEKLIEAYALQLVYK